MFPHSPWIYPMPRCALAAFLVVQLLALAAPAAAQMQRNFPATALRGELLVVQAPEALVNGQPARLAPGVRIRDANNLLVMSGSLTQQRWAVNYTRDTLGLVLDVWLLTPSEGARQPWPTTPAQAAAWAFNADSQTWSRP